MTGQVKKLFIQVIMAVSVLSVSVILICLFFILDYGQSLLWGFVFLCIVSLFLVIYFIARLYHQYIFGTSTGLIRETDELLRQIKDFETRQEEIIQLNEELKQSNDALFEAREKTESAKERFSLLFNMNPDSVTITRLDDGKIVEVNRGFTRLFGYLPGEAIGKSTLQINIWPDQKERERFVEEMKAKGECINFETILCRKNNTLFHALVSTAIIEINGESHFVGVTRDISDLKQAEKMALEAGAKISAIIENTTENIWSVNRDYCIEYVNTPFYKTFKESYGIELKTGLNILELVPPEQKNEWKSRYDRAFNNESFEFEQIFDFGSGQLFFNISLHPIVFHEEVIGVSVFSNNITKRKLSELAVKESEEKYRLEHSLLNTIMETSPVGIVTTDKTGNITYANSRGVQIFRLTKQAVTERTFNAPAWKISDCNGNPFPESELPFIKVRESLKPCYDVQHAIQFDSGEQIILSINAAPILNEKNEFDGMIASIEDISERKRIEIMIREQNKALSELNARKDKFYSILTHDIRSPLASVHQLSQMLFDNFDSYDHAERLDMIAMLEKVSGQTYNLLENLIEWTRAQQGNTPLNIKNHDIGALISENMAFFEVMAKNKNLRVQNNSPSGILALCDKNLTNTVLRNLLSNAIKFSPENGLIEISVAQTGAFIEIDVKDTGNGISSDRIPGLFEISLNKSTPGTSGEKGTGLGLPLCKEFVELQGGTIRVESHTGKGSAFSFSLPVAK
jgi:PAS domain S-box-containing protein